VTAHDSEFGIWGATAPPPLRLPSLDVSLDADVAIVGAGYTGLSTALHLSERGIASVVLEAHEPGWGASGRNTGWLEPNWWLKRPRDIDTLFGAELGAELTRWVASGPALLQRWIERYALRVPFENRGLLMASDQPAKAEELAREVEEWQRAGVDHAFIDAPEIESYVPTRRYRGAMLLKHGVTLNPLELSRELARSATANGAQIFAQSPVTAIERRDDRWRLTTPSGRVAARRLVLATDAYTRTLWPRLERSYATWHAAVVASEPYPEIGRILPRGVAFADLGLANVFTLRQAAGRLVTSTFAPVRRGLAARDVAAPFARKFARVFPQLAAPRWEFRHYGEIGLSKDMMVRLCTIGPDAWTVYGYSGTGINMALLLGGKLAELAIDGVQRAPAFPVTPLEPVALRRTLSCGLRYLHAPLVRHVVSRFA
jgi:glycine/D-amino acid oxidase-like deaminating enzyme